MGATALFPAAAVLISILSYLHPALLGGLGWMIVPLLGVVMLGMGLTLRPENFLDIMRRPVTIALGVGLQYLIMPLSAWLVSRFFELPLELAVGVILVGACPGGTASNVICYLARGDVALSITLTTVSTVLSVIMTPLLTWAYIGQRVPVPVQAMLLDIAGFILLPVGVGVLCNHYAGHYLKAVKHAFPLLSAAAIVLIIGIIVALNSPHLPLVAMPVLAAVFWQNLLGLAGGYYGARLLGLDARTQRTLAIEVGMQNSGLGVALAQLHFSAAAALPGALFSIWHNITGSVLAGYWGAQADRQRATMHDDA